MPTVAEIARGLGFEAEGALDIEIATAAHPSAAGPDELALAMDPKFLKLLAQSKARAAMTPPETDWRALGLEAAIFAPRARYALAGVTRMFEAPLSAPVGVHPTAVIGEGAEIDPTASVGPFTLIGARARIGAGARILGQATIADDAEIGPETLLYHGVRIGRGVRLGARCIVHENAVIGSDGFSFVTPERGSVESAKQTGAVAIGAENSVWARIASIGSVIIGDEVDIGAHAAVDRGTVVNTRIGSGSKIDNFVQVGHNVQIGENCLICGQVGIAGSAELGDRVVLGGQVGVGDQAKIGDDVVVMASSGVSGAVKPRSVVGGTPAMPRADLTAMIMHLRRLPRLARDVAELKNRFSSEKPSG